MSASARNDGKCDENVSEPPWYIHEHRCGNKAKFKARVSGGVVAQERMTFHFCGTHAKRYRRNTNWTVVPISESFS